MKSKRRQAIGMTIIFSAMAVYSNEVNASFLQDMYLLLAVVSLLVLLPVGEYLDNYE